MLVTVDSDPCLVYLCLFQSQPPGPNMIKPGPSMLQSLPPPTTFSMPNQGPPPSLLQAQLSAATLAPLLQNPPQPLLPQPPPKGRAVEPHKKLCGTEFVQSYRRNIIFFCLLCRFCIFWGVAAASCTNDAPATACATYGSLSSLSQP